MCRSDLLDFKKNNWNLVEKSIVSLRGKAAFSTKNDGFFYDL